MQPDTCVRLGSVCLEKTQLPWFTHSATAFFAFLYFLLIFRSKVTKVLKNQRSTTFAAEHASLCCDSEVTQKNIAKIGYAW